MIKHNANAQVFAAELGLYVHVHIKLLRIVHYNSKIVTYCYDDIQYDMIRYDMI